jgi:lipopolysaccharide/colanic/teichoic acid biosynthesis glycosyltransferase
MSFVGPRPEIPSYVALYNERQRKVLSVRPGITDPASIVFADEEGLLGKAPDPNREYVEKLLPRKLELNLQYIKNMSMSYDVRLILRTLSMILWKS